MNRFATRQLQHYSSQTSGMAACASSKWLECSNSINAPKLDLGYEFDPAGDAQSERCGG